MIQEMNELANSDYIFQQDGAHAHTSKHTLAYFAEKLPQTTEILKPDGWPNHSPDLNPFDYGIWFILEKCVFAVKIRDVEHLCDRLVNAWADIKQEEVDKIIGSFIKRVKVCIAANGHRFEYKL
jgi:hypothetical protein